MNVRVKHGEILDHSADALICSANVELKMSGGVNGAILLAGGEVVQHELMAYRTQTGRTWVEPGTIVVTSPGPTRFRCIVHAVAVDGMYQADVETVRTTLRRALDAARERGASSITLTALATGYGRMPLAEFGRALRSVAYDYADWASEVTVVVRHPHEAEQVQRGLME